MLKPTLRERAFGHPQSRWKQLAWLVIGAILFVIMAMQLAISAFYAGKFYPGVTVAGMNIGGLTRGQAQQQLAARVETYQVKLQVADKTYTLKPSELGVVYDLSTTLSDAYLQGHNQWLAPAALFVEGNKEAVRYSYEIDQEKQRQLIDSIVADSGKPPVDAAIVIEDGSPKIQADADGRSLSKEEVAAALDQHIAAARSDGIVLAPKTQQARIRSQHLGPAVDQTKQLLAVPVTITYAGQIFRPTPAQMGSWLTYDKSATDEEPGLTPKLSSDGIKNYLQTVAGKVNQNPVNRKIRVENGQSNEERAGKEGIQLDQDALAEQISKTVAARQAFSGEAPIKKVPFQTEYNRVMTLDYGRYIEINLSQQRLWVYQDKKVIYESPITSGATGSGYPTVTGLFSIQAKQTNRNLNGYAIGYDYNVFVKYWMPFSGNYGLHDASWRSAFGGQDYYYGGSHGCVNLPSATAAFLFGWATVGTPVWVHK